MTASPPHPEAPPPGLGELEPAEALALADELRARK
jgi:hypothetical protein